MKCKNGWQDFSRDVGARQGARHASVGAEQRGKPVGKGVIA